MRRQPPSALRGQLEESAAVLRRRGLARADIGVILGTGLGFGIRTLLKRPQRIAYGDIPHLPHPGVAGHAGELVWGRCGTKRVAIFHGRVHGYEGYSASEIAYGVRLLKRLGGTTLIVTNIAGGLNPDFRRGELMLIRDQINLMGSSPLVGPNDDSLGPRFPDMSEPYDPALRELARAAAAEAGLTLREGVYVGLLGPSLETRAEYRFLRMIGADAVGMSTIPEVLAAVHAGLRVAGVSLISDLCIPETLEPVNLQALLRVARAAEPALTRLLGGLLRRLGGAATGASRSVRGRRAAQLTARPAVTRRLVGA